MAPAEESYVLNVEIAFDQEVRRCEFTASLQHLLPPDDCGHMQFYSLNFSVFICKIEMLLPIVLSSSTFDVEGVK